MVTANRCIKKNSISNGLTKKEEIEDYLIISSKNA